MNLNLKVNGERVSLLQTPTWVTYLIMTNDKGEIMWETEGKKSLGVLRRYILWAKQNIIGNVIIRNEEEKKEHENNKVYIEDHSKYLESLDKEKLNFFIR